MEKTEKIDTIDVNNDVTATEVLDFLDTKIKGEKVAYDIKEIAKIVGISETLTYIVLLEAIIAGYVKRKFAGDGTAYFVTTDEWQKWKEFCEEA